MEIQRDLEVNLKIISISNHHQIEIEIIGVKQSIETTVINIIAALIILMKPKNK